MAKHEPQSVSRLFQKAGRQAIPLNGTFELTAGCNFDCRMCYVRKSPDEIRMQGLIPADDWYALGKEAASQGMLFLLLTGGEPLTYPGFFPLYHRLKSLGLFIALNSNGSLIDEGAAEELASDAPYRIQMTLYGGSEATYERLCRTKNGFQKTIRAMELLKQKKIPFKLNATITPENADDLPEIYRIAREYDVYVQATTYMFPPVRKNGAAAFGTGHRFPAEEAGACMARIERIRFDDAQLAEKEGALKERLEAQRRRFAEEEDCPREPAEPMGCRAGKSSFWVNWKGEMSPCGMMDLPASKPFEEGLGPAWEKVRDFAGAVRMPSKCTSCENRGACMVCGAAVYTETGGFTDREPAYLCRFTESYLKAMRI